MGTHLFGSPCKMWKITSGSKILFKFTFRFYLYLPKENGERKLHQRTRDASFKLTFYVSASVGVSFWRDVVFWLGQRKL